jgi:hypothetical protein
LAGDWIVAEKTDVIFPDLDNPHCYYLPEFPRIKDGISNKHWEKHEKVDFNDWIQASIVDCDAQ